MARVKRSTKQQVVLTLLSLVPVLLLQVTLRFLVRSRADSSRLPLSLFADPPPAGRPRVTLNSQAVYHEVAIPFSIIDGQIVASVKLNGQATIMTPRNWTVV